MLELQNISKSFDGREILHDINLLVPQGATQALIGSSGSGKTTLLRITLGLTSFDKGYVRINNQALLSFTPREWADRIGYVPQEGGLFPHLSARHNVTLTARLRGWDQNKIARRIEELTHTVSLDPQLLARFPSELSGGQRQRIAIMRAAFMDPPVMLLDEPMGALDPLLRRSLQEELKAIFRNLNKTVVIVTHDLGEAAFLAEKLSLLHEGRIIQSGSYKDLLQTPADPFVSFFIHAQRLLPESSEIS